VAADLKPVYQASTIADAALRLDEFAAKWDASYPTISQMWRRNWDHLTPFFADPADIRKVIYTTNAVESSRRRYRAPRRSSYRGIARRRSESREWRLMGCFESNQRKIGT
jgi:transposase-like protein